VDVSPAISHMMWKRPMLEAKLAQLRSLDGKLEENLRGDPSISEAVSKENVETMEEGYDDL
jgi:hypothetical protein